MAGTGGRITKRAPPDWTHLPPELLQLVAGKLTNICDFLRFRSVCTSWHFAAGAADLSPQLPWLLLPYDQLSSSLSFFNPSDHRVYTLDLPSACRKWILGSPHGWLVLLGPGPGPGSGLSVSLLNPITKAEIFLPSLPPELNSPFVTKAVVSAAAASPAVIGIWVHHKLAFCRAGDKLWSVVDAGGDYREGDIAFHEGEFYLVHRDRHNRIWVSVFGIDSPSRRKIEVDTNWQFSMYDMFNLVESGSGELLLVARLGPQSYVIFRLEKGGGMRRVMPGDGIGDIMLFLSMKQSLCLSSKGFPGWSEGCGYFATGDYRLEGWHSAFQVASIRMVDILKGCGVEGREKYWQAEKKHWTDWKDMSGITWMVPSLS